MKYLIVILIFISVQFTYSQGEIITGLTSYPTNQKNIQKSIQATPIFAVDTLQLPFIDDFSTNKIKTYSSDTFLVSYTIDSIYSRLINGDFYTDYVAMPVGDTTIHVTIDSQGDSVFTDLPSIEIINYANSYPGYVLDTIYVWPNYNIITDDSGTSDTLYAFDTDQQWGGTIYEFILLDDDASLWNEPKSKSVFINEDYPINPPSIGVATFDAINEYGELHTGAGENSFYADELTSKPIDLEGLTNSDSVYFSFFYQPQGRGDYPSAGDSLILEFKTEEGWNWIWSSAGLSYNTFSSLYFVDFLQVFKHVDSIYLHDAFQFRFKNISSLAGSLEPSWASNADHWHIDYVQLDKNRSKTDFYFEDVSFVNAPKSLINDYTQVPWPHYLNRTEELIIDSTFNWTYNNDDNSTPKNISYEFNVLENSSSIFTSTQYAINLNPLTGYDFFGITNGLAFNSLSVDSADFLIEHYISTDANDLKENDTIQFNQSFHNLYAYDDGTAEAGYGVSSNGGMIALEFNSIQEEFDTLRGIQMYFNQVVNGANQRSFTLTVWNGNSSGPGDIIYESESLIPQYSDSLNTFIIYELDTTVIIGANFYIGWQQSHEDILNIGFDQNADLENKLYYNIPNQSNSWSISSFSGSPMMRPMFGKELPTPIGIEEELINIDYIFYPNPAKNSLSFNSSSSESAQINIYNLSGQLIFEGNIRDGDIINTLEYSNGLYLIQIQLEGKLFNHKLLIQK